MKHQLIFKSRVLRPGKYQEASLEVIMSILHAAHIDNRKCNPSHASTKIKAISSLQKGISKPEIVREIRNIINYLVGCDIG